jgi:hypothetical protein
MRTDRIEVKAIGVETDIILGFSRKAEIGDPASLPMPFREDKASFVGERKRLELNDELPAPVHMGLKFDGNAFVTQTKGSLKTKGLNRLGLIHGSFSLGGAGFERV